MPSRVLNHGGLNKLPVRTSAATLLVSAPNMKDPIARCILRSRGGLAAALELIFF